MNIVDARDLPCPGPVTRTKETLDMMEQGRLTVLVNTPESCQNVVRFVQSQGCTAKVDEKDGVFTIIVDKVLCTEACTTAAGPVMLITGDQFGTGDQDLGELLLVAFINTLTGARPRPDRMLFINRGVMLTTEGSKVLQTLQQLEKEGVQVLSCGTCLNHYELKDKLRVGKITNMYETVDSLLGAGKVVRI